MSVAVLKNRILDLTERRFKESDYGASTFGEFVRNHDDILALDATQRPPVAILKGVTPASAGASEARGTRVRSDLWQAVLDFSSGEEYIWDDGEDVAKRASDARSSGPVLPTTIGLATFVRYKSLAARLPREPAEVSNQLEAYEAWCELVECEGGRDPRCLPFHIFKSGNSDLDTPERRRHFDDIHGTGARRQDDNELAWDLKPGGFHGRDILHVAGRELPPGFHWDVSVDRARTITTPTEQWRVSKYVNVAPDANVRGRAPFAQKMKIGN